MDVWLGGCNPFLFIYCRRYGTKYFSHAAHLAFCNRYNTPITKSHRWFQFALKYITGIRLVAIAQILVLTTMAVVGN